MHNYRRLVLDRYTAYNKLMRLVFLVTTIFGMTGCGKKVVVPKLVDQDLDTARSMLRAQKLQVGNITGASGVIPQGAYVVAQDPGVNQEVRADSPVNLVVELPVTVPDLISNDMTLPNAVNTLQEMGLKVMCVKQPKWFGKPKIVQQYPPAQSIVRHNSTVTLTVTAPSTPPELGVLISALTNDPAYKRLNPEYRNILDQFLK